MFLTEGAAGPGLQGTGYYATVITLAGELSRIYARYRQSPESARSGYALYINSALARELTRELDPRTVKAAREWLGGGTLEVPLDMPPWAVAMEVDSFYPGGWDAFLAAVASGSL
jgi:hypothetical protein